MGYCLALGALPHPVLTSSLVPVLEGLVGVASHIDGCESQFTESRRDAVRSISKLVSLQQCTVHTLFVQCVSGCGCW